VPATPQGAPAPARSEPLIQQGDSKAMEGILTVMIAWFRARLGMERGASLVEYGLLLGLIAIIAIVAVKAFGQGVSTQFNNITASVNS
jgi:pilus assembly protein Flp/PilA